METRLLPYIRKWKPVYSRIFLNGKPVYSRIFVNGNSRIFVMREIVYSAFIANGMMNDSVYLKVNGDQRKTNTSK